MNMKEDAMVRESVRGIVSVMPLSRALGSGLQWKPTFS